MVPRPSKCTPGNQAWSLVKYSYEVVPRGECSNVQSAVNDIQNHCNALRFTLNNDKCKEMRIQFNKCNTNRQLHPVTINGKQAELIFESKVFGLTITSDLKWNSQTDKIVKKASKRKYFL